MSIFSSLFGSIFKKDESVLGIDIGSSAIKVVQIRKKRGKAVLETYGELSLGPYAGTDIGRSTNLPPDKIAQALKDLFTESKKFTATNSGLALPLSSSLISFITIPPVSPDKVKEVVSLEARKYIPVPLDEVMMDFSPIPREDDYVTDEDTKVDSSVRDFLVVAIHKQYLTDFQSIVTNAHINAGFFEIEIFSSIRSVIDRGVHTDMIIDMGARSTKLYIIERGVLRASHIINKGSQDITLAISKAMSIPVSEAERLKRSHGLKGGPEYKELTEIITVNLDYIFYEANATLLNYQKKYSKNIKTVILTGGGVLLRGFVDLARIGFQTEVIYADPFGKLETPAFLAEEFAKAGPEFAVAIGVAIRRLNEVG